MLMQIFLFTLLTSLNLADNDLEKLFKDTKVIPDVIQTAPKEKLKVKMLKKI